MGALKVWNSTTSQWEYTAGAGGWETGDIKPTMRATPGAGWLLMDGSEQAIANYTNLYNALTANGTVFPYGANTNGSGAAGSTHFRLPDARDRYLVGVGSSHATGDTEGLPYGSPRDAAHDLAHAHATGNHTHVLGDHTHLGGSHTHSAGSYVISAANDRATGTGARGASPVTGTSGGQSAAWNTQGMNGSPSTGTRSDGAADTGTSNTPELPNIATNWLIKT